LKSQEEEGYDLRVIAGINLTFRLDDSLRAKHRLTSDNDKLY